MIIAIGKDAEKLKQDLPDEEYETYEVSWWAVLLWSTLLFIILDWLRHE